MPSPKVPCPKCGEPKSKRSKVCQHCFVPYERTPEHRESMSEQFRGRINPWWKGQKHKPEDLEKMRKAWTPEMREAARIRGIKRHEDHQVLIELGRKLSGKNNPNYQGKGQESPYSPGWGRIYRKRIRDRANGRCERCNKTVNYTLDLHHKDFGKDNHSDGNLDVLCRSCHKILHFANSSNT